jgi:hypothetical protein
MYILAMHPWTRVHMLEWNFNGSCYIMAVSCVHVQYFIMVLLIFTLEITAGTLAFIHKDAVSLFKIFVIKNYFL